MIYFCICLYILTYYTYIQTYRQTDRKTDRHTYIHTYIQIIYMSLLFADAMTAILLVALMFVQNLRRLLECWFVSVYSNSTMNVIHFGLGILLYTTFHLAVLAEAPDIKTYRGE